MPDESNCHPMQLLIAHVAKDGAVGQEQVAFDTDGLGKIRDAIDHYINTDELFEAVQTVLVIAHAVETEQRAPNAAGQLIDIVDRNVVLEAMKAQNEAFEAAKAEHVAKKAEEFSNFTDAGQSRSGSNDPPPEGAIKVGTLAFPKRL